jgi:4-hydroxythreonine-4-phosphate dehydrogenase
LPDLPLIAVTMGDPSGIGPEIIVKALIDPEITAVCRPVVFGDPGALRLYLKARDRIAIDELRDLSQAMPETNRILVWPLSRLAKQEMLPGRPSPAGGQAMVNYIVKAVEQSRQGAVAAMVTGPISKSLMHQAGYRFEGHTELIAHLTRTKEVVMMLAGSRLRVALVTIHCALKEVPALLHQSKIFRTLEITWQALKRDFGLAQPRLAVAALNPHAGEAGLFGHEEQEQIQPAVEKAQKQGMNVAGPFPADTLFYQAVQGRFDAVIAMYHDQGLIPLKLLHFSDAVNITLGLPIIRTSVDHGTAYDIAGKDQADPRSLVAAVKLAVKMAENRAKGQ